LCLGFWIDALISRFNKIYSKRVKIVSFIAAIFVGSLSIIGLLFIFVIPNNATLGKILLVIPILVTAVGEIVTCIIIYFWKIPSEGISKDHVSYTKLKKWSFPLFACGTVLWSLHALSLIIASISNDPLLWIVLNTFWLLNSAGTTLINYLLTSRRKGIVELSRWIFLGEDLPQSTQSKDTSSTNNAATEPEP